VLLAVLEKNGFWREKTVLDFGKTKHEYDYAIEEYSKYTRYIQYLLDKGDITFYCQDLLPIDICFKLW